MEGYIVMVILLLAFGIFTFCNVSKVAACLIFIFAGWLSGWYFAHTTVATECERLGKFYVGKKVFECTKIKDIKTGEK